MAITIESCEADIMQQYHAKKNATSGADYITAENKLWAAMGKLALIIDEPIEMIWVNGSGITENVSTMTDHRLHCIVETIIFTQAKVTLKRLEQQNVRHDRNLGRMDRQLKYIKKIKEDRCSTG